MRHKVIVDCDNTYGLPSRPIDDGQTLLYLLGRDDIDILGITTTFGNGPVEDITDATEWLIRHSCRPDIPVIRGNGRPGEQPNEAARFLAERAAEFPGEISLLAIGTMGNPAAAAGLDEGFFPNLRQITCMGGYRHTLPVRGWNRINELNFSRDARAAVTVLKAPCPVAVFDAHVCLQAPFGLRELAPFAGFDRRSYFIQLDYLLSNMGELTVPVDYLWDLLPAVYISLPELFHPMSFRVTATAERIAAGTLDLEPEEGEGAGYIVAPDYITDIDRFYSVLYEAWEKSPLVF